MNQDAASRRRRRAPRAARHGACIVKQGPRRHPCRQSRPLQAGASAAPGWDGRSLADFVRLGGLRSTRSASCLAAVRFSCRSSGELSYARQQQGKNRLTVAWLITPRPPQGGFGRPSNITRDYAQASLPGRRAAGRPARPTPARPHNQRYVKWPRRSCSTRRPVPYGAAFRRPPWRQRLRAPGARWGLASSALRAGQKPARARSPKPPGPLDGPPAQVAGRGGLQPLRVFRIRHALPPLNDAGSVERSLPAHADRLAPCSTRQGSINGAKSAPPLTSLRAALAGSACPESLSGR